MFRRIEQDTSAHRDPSGVWCEQSSNAVEQRGLPCSGGTEQNRKAGGCRNFHIEAERVQFLEDLCLQRL